jgi:lipoprotein-anchoring transpeptidase ErfK/SrfK
MDGRKQVFPIGTGKALGDKQRVGDYRTPIGSFRIKAIKASADWAYDFEDDDQGPIVGAYGPWFLELDTPWQGIAIHGTHDESTIGKNDSHGCVRMRNRDLVLLKERITINFPVEITE